jgi:hypothetical protein
VGAPDAGVLNLHPIGRVEGGRGERADARLLVSGMIG